MTPAEFRAVRKRLGLSQDEMAKFLRLSDARAVRFYEAGARSISGPIQVAIEMREILAELIKIEDNPGGSGIKDSQSDCDTWASEELEDVISRARAILVLPGS